MADSKAGTFNAYLEYAQRGSSDAGTRPSGLATLLSVLTQFPEDGAPMGTLADLSGMSAQAFREILKKLADSGFIEISGAPLSETVKITSKGREVVTLL
jgi:predicted transcriptional regulator